MNLKERVERVLRDAGYKDLDAVHVLIIAETWGNQEEFTSDPDRDAICFAYEVLSCI